MMKRRLWRVVITHRSGCQAPSFWVETSTPKKESREKAEMEAIELAKEKSGLGKYETWKFEVIHLENKFFLETSEFSKWVEQGIYSRNEKGRWQRVLN